MSQKQWLDESQGYDKPTHTMQDMAARVGKLSGKLEFAEEFGAQDFDALASALSCVVEMKCE